MQFTLDNPKFSFLGMQQLLGYKVFEDKNMVDKFRNKIHKKKRIDKKYLKKFGFYEVPKKDVYVMGMNIIGHPTVISVLKNSL